MSADDRGAHLSSPGDVGRGFLIGVNGVQEYQGGSLARIGREELVLSAPVIASNQQGESPCQSVLALCNRK